MANQLKFIERFNKTYRNEVRELYLFCKLNEVRKTPNSVRLNTKISGHTVPQGLGSL